MWCGTVRLQKPSFYKIKNAELQRIARRDKEDFLNDQCKDTEENNRTGKIHPFVIQSSKE